jgi:hypothetical protein
MDGGMTDRPARPTISAARRARIFADHAGVCHICRTRIAATELWDVEHKIARGLTYDDSDANLAPAHRSEDCHGRKTKEDVTRIAKAKAQGGETGQWARRQKRGVGLIQSRGFEKPKVKRAWPKGRKL